MLGTAWDVVVQLFGGSARRRRVVTAAEVAEALPALYAAAKPLMALEQFADAIGELCTEYSLRCTPDQLDHALELDSEDWLGFFLSLEAILNRRLTDTEEEDINTLRDVITLIDDERSKSHGTGTGSS